MPEGSDHGQEAHATSESPASRLVNFEPAGSGVPGLPCELGLQVRRGGAGLEFEEAGEGAVVEEFAALGATYGAEFDNVVGFGEQV